jgi:hypothetical protein
VDDHGNPVPGALISEEEAQSLPLDAESSRMMAQHKKTMSLKAGGMNGVPWSPDHAIRYGEAVTRHPAAYVRIKQLKPLEHDGIPSQPVSALPNYDALVAYLRERHWKGDNAEYKWFVYDDSNFQWATGTIKFAARPQEDSMSRPPGQGGPWGPGPYPGQWGPQAPGAWQPPGYGPPPGYGGQQYAAYPMPAQQVPPQPAPPWQQQAPQQQPQQPAPAPPAQIQMPAGVDPVLGALLTQLMQQLNDSRNECSQLRYQMHYGAQQQYAPPQAQGYGTGAPVPHADAAQQPAQPKSAMDQLNEMATTFLGVHGLTTRLQHVFGGDVVEENPVAPPVDDPGFPVKIKDVGLSRMTAVPDSDGTWQIGEKFNYEKAFSYLPTAMDKLGEFIDKVSTKRNEQETATMEKKVELMERAQAVAERQARFQHMLGSGPQPVVHAAPRAAPPPVSFGGAVVPDYYPPQQHPAQQQPRDYHPPQQHIAQQPPIVPPAPVSPPSVVTQPAQQPEPQAPTSDYVDPWEKYKRPPATSEVVQVAPQQVAEIPQAEPTPDADSSAELGSLAD